MYVKCRLESAKYSADFTRRLCSQTLSLRRQTTRRLWVCETLYRLYSQTPSLWRQTARRLWVCETFCRLYSQTLSLRRLARTGLTSYIPSSRRLWQTPKFKCTGSRRLWKNLCISLSNLRWVGISLGIGSESVHTFLSLIFGSLKLIGNGSFLFTRSTHIGDFDLCRRRASEITSVKSYSPKPGHHREDFEIHKGFPL